MYRCRPDSCRTSPGRPEVNRFATSSKGASIPMAKVDCWNDFGRSRRYRRTLVASTFAECSSIRICTSRARSGPSQCHCHRNIERSCRCARQQSSLREYQGVVRRLEHQGKSGAVGHARLIPKSFRLKWTRPQRRSVRQPPRGSRPRRNLKRRNPTSVEQSPPRRAPRQT